jgi:hypothetical protein
MQENKLKYIIGASIDVQIKRRKRRIKKIIDIKIEID